MRRLFQVLACLLPLTSVPLRTVSAQERAGAPGTGSITGVVVDATRDVGIPGAMIVIDGTNRGTLSDSLGVFEIGDVPPGQEALSIRQYGYQQVGALVNVVAGQAVVLEVALSPDPEMLDGITVVAERLATMQQRLASRRKAAPVSTRAYQLEALMRSPAWDVRDFLRLEAFLHIYPCGGGSAFGECVWRRGRLVLPRIYIDEMPMIGGLEQLALYRPHELYLLEVYSSGQEIRAYTHQFMERMARRPMALIPVFLP